MPLNDNHNRQKMLDMLIRVTNWMESLILTLFQYLVHCVPTRLFGTKGSFSDTLSNTLILRLIPFLRVFTGYCLYL